MMTPTILALASLRSVAGYLAGEEDVRHWTLTNHKLAKARGEA